MTQDARRRVVLVKRELGFIEVRSYGLPLRSEVDQAIAEVRRVHVRAYGTGPLSTFAQTVDSWPVFVYSNQVSDDCGLAL
jgi:hypothetical protein